MSAVTELGAILVDKQVIPLKTYEGMCKHRMLVAYMCALCFRNLEIMYFAGEWIPCKVAMRSGRLPLEDSNFSYLAEKRLLLVAPQTASRSCL